MCWITGQFGWPRAVVCTWLGIDCGKVSGAGGPTERRPFASHRARVLAVPVEKTRAAATTANRAKGPRIPQISTDDGLALRPAHSPVSSASHRRGRRPDLPSLFRRRLLSPSQPNQGAMSSPVVRRALLLSLICAGALGFLPCSHGAAVAPGYVTVSAARFRPSSTCSSLDPGTRIVAA